MQCLRCGRETENEQVFCFLCESVMESDIGPIAPYIARGDIASITAWLREHIHRFGNMKKPAAIFEDACGKFDPNFFTDYLTEKYSRIYGL